MFSKNAASTYADCLYLNTALSDGTPIIKNAQVIDSIKGYFDQQIDKSNPTHSIMAILTPGILGTIAGLLGFNYAWKIVIGLAASALGLNIDDLFQYVKKEVMALVSSKKQITKEELTETISNTIRQHIDVPSESNVSEASSLQVELRKAAIINYRIKTAGFVDSKLLISILTKFFGLVFQAALLSLGVMVVGDVINYGLGRPNAFSGNKQTSITQQQSLTQVSEVDKLFPRKPEGSEKVASDDVWEEDIQNNRQNIENMVIQFANDSRENLQGLEGVIRNTSAFKKTVDNIESSNSRMIGANIVLIPVNYRCKLDVTDTFIGQVAAQVSKSKAI